jgi:hypothetical protein
MKKITDDDLTLLYYGELDDPALAASVASSPELTARYEALGLELNRVDDFVPPERGDDYGADVWRRISPKLATDQNKPADLWKALKSVVARPRFSLAGAMSLTLVAVLAFMLGRQGEQPGNPASAGLDAMATAALAEMDSGRLLTSSVSGHLEQLNIAFTQFANMPETSAADAGRATDMLVANRLYRQAAVAQGKHKLAAFLSELEPLLIELAYEAHKTSPATRDRMQQEVRDKLLFRVRIMNKQLDHSNIST